jgi:chromosome segregation ATPase
VEEALQVWRDGERLLEELPPLTADHETVRLNVAALREAYRTLTGQSSSSKEQIADCQRQIASAHETIRHVREKLSQASR